MTSEQEMRLRLEFKKSLPEILKGRDPASRYCYGWLSKKSDWDKPLVPIKQEEE